MNVSKINKKIFSFTSSTLMATTLCLVLNGFALPSTNSVEAEGLIPAVSGSGFSPGPVARDSNGPVVLSTPTQYNHGNPTIYEQLMLELVNRARANPGVEAARLGMAHLNVGLPAGTIEDTPKQPLAFQNELISAARAHSQWMLDNNTFDHTGVNGSNPRDRMEAAGYVFSGWWTWGENIAVGYTTGTPNMETYTIARHEDLFKSTTGHRQNLCNEGFDEIGIGVREGKYKTYNAVMATQNFARSGATPGPLLLGVVFADNDGDGFYDPGEGRQGVNISIEGGEYFAESSLSGGYALPYPYGSGTMQVTFSGPALPQPVSYTINGTGENIKLDLNLADLPKEVSFQLTVIGGTGSGMYSNDVSVIISANIPSNLIFKCWTAVPAIFTNRIQDLTAASTSFTMPDTPVELKANFLKRPYSGGQGTEESPYLIESAADFMELAAATAHYAKHFKLTSDIDLTGKTFARAVIAPNAPGGGTTYSGVAFTGVFDGNGHVIRNVNIVTTLKDESNIGVFGRLSGAGCEVRQLGIENITVTDPKKSARFVGGLCGQIRNGAAINQCYVKNANLQGKWYVGGFVGVGNGSAAITDCFASGAARTLTGGSYVGGFCGINEVSSKLKNCYSTTAVTGVGTKGGFCATKDATSTATGCFWNTATSGLSTSAGGGTGRTTTQMKSEPTFTNAGWNFTAIWLMDGYPELRAFTEGESPYQQWLTASGVPLDKQGIGDTPAGDGVPNLLKYASGLDAMTPATTGDLMNLPANPAPGMFEIIYYQAKDLVGANLEPLYASSLAGPWSTAGVTIEKTGEEGEREIWKASVPRATGGFMKLSASLAE